MARAIRHGTYAGYIAGCTDECCKAAKRAYRDRQRRLQAYGRWQPWGDLATVRAHLIAQRAQGLAWGDLSARNGVEKEHLRRLATTATQVHAHIAEQILHVPIQLPPSPRGLTPAIGLQRRLQALACLGWTSPDVAAESGATVTTVRRILMGLRSQTTGATRLALLDAYDRLSMRTAPASATATAARMKAERLGWIPPLAWDDDLIDLPEADHAEEITRRVAAMEPVELGRCYRAVLAGERSPVMVAAATEHNRHRSHRKTRAA